MRAMMFRIMVRRMLKRSEVARGMMHVRLSRWITMSPGSLPRRGTRGRKMSTTPMAVMKRPVMIRTRPKGSQSIPHTTKLEE
jgi:hypothetical protein